MKKVTNKEKVEETKNEKVGAERVGWFDRVGWR